MQPSTDNQNASDDKWADSYEEIKDDVIKLPADQLKSMNLDPLETAKNVLGVLPNIRALLPEIMAAIPTFNAGLVDFLEKCAGAVIFLDILMDSYSKAPAKVQLIAERALQRRDIFLTEISILIKLGLLPESCLDNMQGAVRYTDIAHDLMLGAQHLSANYDAIKARTRFTLEEIADGRALGQELLTVSAERDKALEKAPEMSLNRQRAYSLMVRTYDRIWHAVAYTRQDYGDEDKFMPSLWANRMGKRVEARGSTREQNKEQDREQDEPAAQPVTGAASKPAKAVPPQNGAPIPVGLPGGDPLLPG